jgi:hypothetical protein
MTDRITSLLSSEPAVGLQVDVYVGPPISPQFHCCVSGTSVGIAKDPVAVLELIPPVQYVGRPVKADYSRSYSATSTIEYWEIDWGDGNVSNGAWPGPGSVDHPMGGYDDVGRYKVTLTVRDILGAEGRDRQWMIVVPPDFTAYIGVHEFEEE